jgi:hypothetical protein
MPIVQDTSPTYSQKRVMENSLIEVCQPDREPKRVRCAGTASARRTIEGRRIGTPSGMLRGCLIQSLNDGYAQIGSQH